VAWHGDEATWRHDLEQLPARAQAAVAGGTRRAFSWIWPASDELAWADNWTFHLDRLRPVVDVLSSLGCGLALEYVGPATMRAGKRHEFIHTLRQALELAVALGSEVGVLVDSFHWYTSGGDPADLREVPPERIGYVHVNDAPAGLGVREQLDRDRRLPGATGVIDLRAFIGAVRDAGYDGPVVVETFEGAFEAHAGDEESRVAATAAALRDVLGAG
jgi:sugar phosphate isomerase/epimerase